MFYITVIILCKLTLYVLNYDDLVGLGEHVTNSSQTQLDITTDVIWVSVIIVKMTVLRKVQLKCFIMKKHWLRKNWHKIFAKASTNLCGIHTLQSTKNTPSDWIRCDTLGMTYARTLSIVAQNSGVHD